MKKKKVSILFILSVAIFASCMTQGSNENPKDQVDEYIHSNPNYIFEYLSDNEEVIYEYLEMNKNIIMTYNENHEFPNYYTFLGEAEGNARAIKMLFDFAEEIGYGPSIVVGRYYIDKNTWNVHNIDSECIYSSDYNKIIFCSLFGADDLSTIQSIIKANENLSAKNISFCQQCIG